MNTARLFWLGIIISALIFSKSLTLFYTHDDFFHFYISRAGNIQQFIQFFNPLNNNYGYGWYRPLSTQIPYFIFLNIFSGHPFFFHLFIYLLFIYLIFLVRKFTYLLTLSHDLSNITGFFYALSATHLNQIYFIANQEIIHAVFYILSVIYLLIFVIHKNIIKYYISLLFLILALLSKEFAVTLPVVFGLLLIRYKKSFKYLIFPILVTGLYLFIKINYYGLARGESYIWDFSLRIFNTAFWYGLWSLNLPEMLVDFIGPGLHINPNLFKYWSASFTLIFPLFTILIIHILYSLYKYIRKLFTNDYLLTAVFCFLVPLFPVLFLPWHKFSYYLTIPAIGTSLLLAYLLQFSKPIVQKSFVLTWVFLFIISVNLADSTGWISKGMTASARVHQYLTNNVHKSVTEIIFYDFPEDSRFPWSPAMTLKTVLSDNNYFQVFWPKKYHASYLTTKPDKIEPNQIALPAVDFLGY